MGIKVIANKPIENQYTKVSLAKSVSTEGKGILLILYECIDCKDPECRDCKYVTKAIERMQEQIIYSYGGSSQGLRH